MSDKIRDPYDRAIADRGDGPGPAEDEDVEAPDIEPAGHGPEHFNAQNGDFAPPPGTEEDDVAGAYGMYTEAGNERVDEVVRDAVAACGSAPRAYALASCRLERVAAEAGFEEATDTVVRDAVYEAIQLAYQTASPARSGFTVDDLQAVEPDELPRVRGVRVVVADDLDSMGFNRVALFAPTREALVEYVREQWGDDDAGWFREYVVDRIEKVGEAAPTGRTILVHLNVEVPASDTRSADEIADAVLAAYEVGSDDDRVRDLKVVSPLAEEV